MKLNHCHSVECAQLVEALTSKANAYMEIMDAHAKELDRLAAKEWVGLTNEEKHQLNDILNLQGRFPVIDAIEAKLKEKNT